ncbi:MAG: hypothetical protein COY66_03600 [Candidatus Kerfeldbacteria bacterium CG_4_10_14_0_8_um_filter_42_10]|uniref:DUF456 domain-containing protein n=1 Tax=Candidatus Kerfeldbacteria bacterium CG_4_10_14_0_8_um_filter_42_10 TaxID=2014248 RepID=A0A2M7RJF2_9BACT|nr:MAG: hypothetical protein COY66_03600 [Candidatus Kerfeldbacteria bacterium CG_4_10_14_0_8_um_filter_42_10]
MTFSHLIIVIISLVIMLFGLLGVIFPFFPGIIIIWVALFLYSGITQFKIVTLDYLFLATLITFIAIFLDYVAGYWGTKKINASLWGVGGAIAGGILGSVFGWLPALLIGPFVGAMAGEVFSGRDEIFKIEFKTYTIIGFVGGTLVKMSAGVAIIGLFIYKIFQNF